MGFFSSDKPHVSQNEFVKVISSLWSHQFGTTEIHHIKMIFIGCFMTSSDYDRGVDRYKLEKIIEWMRENTSIHTVSENHITILEEEMQKYF